MRRVLGGIIGLISVLGATLLGLNAAPLIGPFASSSGSVGAQSVQNAAGNTLKIDAKLVPVRVVVRDSKGQTIGGLTKDDFQILDNGKPQVISQFFIEQNGGAAAAETTPGAAANTLRRAVGARFTAYLIDDLHLEQNDLIRTREAIDRQLAHLEPTERVAIFTTSGQAGIDFTGDAEKLRATVDRLKPLGAGQAICPVMSYYLADLIQNQGDEDAASMALEDTRKCAFGGNPKAGNAAQQQVKVAASEALAIGRAQTQKALKILKELVQGMSKAPGQRIIVLISPGIYCERYDAEEEIQDLAVRGDVIVSALDPSGLSVMDGDLSRVSDGSMSDPVKTSSIRKQMQLAEWTPLDELADATGGTFFRNNNDLGAGLRAVAASPEFSYVLAFAPEDADGKFHKLKVTVRGPEKSSVQARHGYFAAKPK